MARHYANPRYPSSPRELAEALADPERAAEIFGASPESWDEFNHHYARSVAPELEARSREATQMVLAQHLQSTRGAPGLSFGANPVTRNRLYSKRAPGTAVDRVFEHSDAPWGEFLQAIHPRNEGGARVRGEIRAGMSTEVPSEGGFLVPETLRSDILMATLEKAIVRPRCQIVPMNTLRVPYPTIDDVSHTSSVLGGVVGYWTEEGAALQESQPAFGRTVLEAKKLTFYTDVPNELQADAPGLASFIERVLPDAVAFFEDQAFLTGSGVGEPLGVVNAAAAVQVTRATASQVNFADIVSMYSRMLPVALDDAVWICSPAVVGQLLQMYLNAGGTTPVAPPLWLSFGNGSPAAGDPPTHILGRPLFVTEKMPDLGGTGDLAFVNWSYYLLGDRQALTAEMSREYKFANDMTSWRIIERCDGRPWLTGALTPANGGATLSPYVLLAA